MSADMLRPVPMTALTRSLSVFGAELQRIGLAARRVSHVLRRLSDTPGDRHIERIVRDCLDRRLPPEQATIRLIAASDFAAVLDGCGSDG